ncbi:acetyl-CoA carboxylase biotin carboxylase subunit family protein [Streptomyces sp. NPDC006879]|uniref:ATP-grasp domain-containing protein n=1 Tax=Streptomyces sp. NPDC006879 TaxID=3364767 RepID=UPI0036B002F3
MSVLVLHHMGSLNAVPYDRWLADYEGDVVLLACARQLALVAEELPHGGGYLHAEAVVGYEDSGLLEERALELARTHGVRHLVSCHELDLDRAAGLREILDLPGQRLDSVTPFRDKGSMKEIASGAGLAVAPWRDVECAGDLLGFVREHGLPVVVKPRDSAGSMGLRILHTEVELSAYLADEFDLYSGDHPNLIVEAFVRGPMCHVDGLVLDGKVVLSWPSQYQYALATYRTDTGPRMDLTLDVDDPLAKRLLEFTERLLEAMPGPPNFTFHAEVFHTPDDELVLCEIACRTGGAAIRDIMRTLFGVDPTEAWVRAQLGLSLPAELGSGGVPLAPRQMSGQMVLMKRPGRVVEVPLEAPDFPWIEKFRVFVRPGQVMEAAAGSSDFLVTVLVSGRDRAQCVERLRQVEEWFMAALVLEPVPAG